MRIDKVLWYLRLAPSRAAAREWVEVGHIRLGGRRIEKPAAAVKAGDVLTLPLPGGVKVIALETLPIRRGPASEAQSCYRVLDAGTEMPIAASDNTAPEGTSEP